MLLIEKEYNIEALANDLNERVEYAEEYDKFNVKVPITKAMEILDVLYKLSEGVKYIKEVL